ncbi:MAG: NADPH-dependent 2,4-dienoyl-CoA reductase/sulfur reductase-like enzyme, partial [Verrucomicrobiales bacterium]
MLLHTRHAFLILIHLLISTTPAAEVVETDICIYGGTSGGVAAAVQARRMGKRVVLLEPGRHLGGLTSGGLGKTDTGNAGSIGGISSEFYTEIGQDYGTGRSFTFEPHVAEARYETWIERNNIPVYREQLLAAVRMNGKRITEIEMRNGN